QATALFSNVVSLFPQSSEAAEALFALAQIEQINGNLRGAAKSYYKLVYGYPFSSRKAQAKEQLRQLTIIAESLSARKGGRKVPLVLTPKNIPSASAEKTEQKKVAPPLKPAAASTFAAPSFGATTAPEKIALSSSSNQVISEQKKMVVEEKKPQQKIILPLFAEPVKPAQSKTTASIPAGAEKVPEHQMTPKTSALFFNDEHKKEATKPAAATPRVPQPEPSKPAVATVKMSEQQAKIVVSELKIASLDSDKMTIQPSVLANAPSSPKSEQLKHLSVQVKSETVQSATSVPLLKEEPKAAEPPKPDKPALAKLLPIQHWSSDSYNRVAVSISSPAVYQAELPDKNKKQLRLEFKQSHIPPELRTPIAVNNGLIKTIHAEQTDGETVQVSLYLAEDADSKIFSLNDPFRVVVDLRKAATAPEQAAAETQNKPSDQEKKENEKTADAKKEIKPEGAQRHGLTLAQQLGLGIRRIMIDPGHGGKDTGATGFGLEEKNIVLDVAKRVRELLKKENYEVLLTREQDVLIPLEERTAIANTKGTDLFLSIHVNAHPKATVKGVETYYLNLAANPDAMRVAALENATSTRSISEMQGILASLMKNTKIDESSLLAEFIQTSMTDGLRRYKVKNLGVKKAPFYVLIGAQMPAVLAEISFISNKEEAALLKDDQYLQAIAKQIAVGVVAYIEHRRTEATAAIKTGSIN
ncbi:N-acetylmuramoyl-L-alanine amidase, partial [Desulfobulbus sp. F4]|nr:N-acetylmuramoyl-L-alanine amidase [Desulfobulbus sp. F4]